MPPSQYKHILKPSVDYLRTCGTLVLRTQEMAEFLGVERKVAAQLVGTDRIPLPMKLGFGMCMGWNIFELIDWVEADCPGRTKWIEMRGHTGWYPEWRWKLY